MDGFPARLEEIVLQNGGGMAFSKKTGIEDETVLKLLKGLKIPTVGILMTIADTCKVSLDWLVAGAEF